ncbi:MAG: alpha/beta hydrolase [Deltaproteobacteria bacterium]|nr:alpha/beta hydrolase [Deltaproteobacteria bacterium]
MRALILPGADLGPPFYAPLEAALERRGLPASTALIPESASWDARVEVVRAGAASAAGAAGAAGAPGGVILVGHSLGGLLGLLAAARSPQVRGLALLEPAIVPSARFAGAAARRYVRDVVLGDRTRFSNWSGTYRRVHDLESFPSWAVAHYLEQRRRGDVEAARALILAMPSLYPLPFERIAVPVLILRGASSGFLARVGFSSLAKKLPQAEVKIIPGAAHWMANEQDEAIAAAIAAWWARALQNVSSMPNRW